MSISNSYSVELCSTHKYVIYLITFYILFGISANLAYGLSQPNPDSTYFERAQEKRRAQNYKGALAIWDTARKELDEPDFRIAQFYIEVVTANQLKNYYAKATEMYFWGLSGTVTNQEKHVLLKELRFLKPLISTKQYNSWKKKIENANTTPLREIKRFWKDKDPTPLNKYNERLIEHWKRIDYAIKNYSISKSDKLDDRGQVYLKYGAPYINKNGQLNYKSSLVHRLLMEGIQTPSFGDRNDIAIASSKRYSLENRVRQLHNYPKYEVWIYRNLTDESQNTIFMFGTLGASNQFEKVNSIEDFIPSTAYRDVAQNNYSSLTSGSSNSGNSQNDDSDVQLDAARQSQSIEPKINISPALILQLMYYEQFAALDQYFGRSYNEMMDQYISQANTGNSTMKGLSREFGSMYGNKLVHIESRAPREKTKTTSEILSMPTQTYSYRFLDNNNEPYLKTYAKLQFDDAIYYDHLKKTNTLEDGVDENYTLISGYVLKSENDTVTTQLASRKAIESAEESVDILEIPYNTDYQEVTLSFELHNLQEINDNTISERTVFTNSLKGLTNVTIDVPNRLSKTELTLSDVIIGYRFPSDDFDFSSDTLTYTVAHEKVIPQGSNLYLYHELYNLSPNDSTGTAQFTFDYSVKEKRSKFLGIFNRKPDESKSVVLNNTITEDRFKKTLTIKTSNLEKGKYILVMKAEDLNSNTRVSKELEFVIK